MEQVQSPCIQVCVLKSGVCVGCFRTIEEIAGWRDYTMEQQQQVLDRIFTLASTVGSASGQRQNKVRIQAKVYMVV